jgi:hypothetical protein
MDEYPTRDYKLALCLESGKTAKVEGIKEYGVGEDLTFSLFGWCGDRLAVIATMGTAFMNDSQPRRIKRVAQAASILRRGWGVDEFVFMAEGFVSVDSERSAGRDLREVFIEEDSPVSECLTLTFVTPTDYEVVTAPYHVGLGRVVEWGSLMRTRDSSSLRDTAYPVVIQKALHLSKEVEPEGHKDIYFKTLAAGLEKEGFGTQWDFD